MLKINLGRGKEYKEGYINCDISKEVKADKHFDISEGIPIDSNVADIILCYNVLEQVPKEKFCDVMNELWRVSNPEGKVFIRMPLAPYKNAFQDPKDLFAITEDTFDYFDYTHRRYNQYGKNSYNIKPWDIIDKKVETKDDWGQISIVLRPYG